MTQSSRDRAPADDAGRGGPGRRVSPRDVDAAEELLSAGRLTVEGRLVQASNATLYCSVELGGLTAACVYKPVAGERPLWDFPDGTLAEREVAAYEVSKAMGWATVPPTVPGSGPDGPGGVGRGVGPSADIDQWAWTAA